MIKSMTGYGRGEWLGDAKKVEVEIKSVNHRYLEISSRLPRRLNPLENQLRNLIRQRLSRGRIEVTVSIDGSPEEQRLELDFDVARDYLLALKTLQESFGIPGEIRLETLANFREIFTRQETEPDLEREWGSIQVALEESLRGLERMRQEEGKKLREDLLYRLSLVEKMGKEIEAQSPYLLKAAGERLAERVAELSGGVELDPARLAQEVAYLAERSDVTEELVRLRSHLIQFREMLDRPEPMGRKLDFLVQEINREVNTIGSKTSGAEVAQTVVEIKSELEKIREQIQNVE